MAVSLGQALLTIGGDATPLARALGQAQTKTQHAMQRIGQASRMAGYAFTAMGTVITGAMGLAIKSVMQFGKGFAEVASLGVNDLEKLKAAVLDVSARYGLDLKDAVNATYQALSSGIPEENIPEFLEKASKAAIAGMTDLTTTVEFGSTQVSVWGTEVQKLFDQAFVAVKLGIIRFEELNHGIGRLSPTMKAAGLSSEEMFSAVAALTTQGIQAREAISGMKAALSNIIKPSESATAAAGALNIQFDAATLRTKGLKVFLTELEQTIKTQGPALAQYRDQLEAQLQSNAGLNTEVKAQIEYLKQVRAEMKDAGQNTAEVDAQIKQLTGGLKLSKEEIANMKREYKALNSVSEDTLTMFASFFGSVEALNVVLALSSEGGMRVYDKSMIEMGASTSATAEAFAQIVENDPSLAWRQLGTEIEVLKIKIGEALLPSLKAIVEILKPIVESFIQWITANPELTATMVKVVAGVGLLMTALGPILIMMPGIVAVVGAAAAAIGALVSPVFLVAAAIGAVLIPVFMYLDEIMAAAKGWITAHWDAISKAFDQAKQLLYATMNAIYQVLRVAFNIIGVVLDGFGMGVSKTWDRVGGDTKTFSGNWIDYITELMKMTTIIMNTIADVIGRVAEFIVNNWDTIAGGTSFFVNQIVFPLLRLASVFMQVAITIVSAINWILGAIAQLPGGVLEFLGLGGAQAPFPIGQNASGTKNWRGGLTWMGEKGRELVALPAGSRVYSNQDSEKMAGTTFNFGGIVINGANKTTPEIANEIARELERKIQSRFASRGMRLATA